MTIGEYAIKWIREEDNNFAVACADQNSIEELQCAVPDKTDMKTWGLKNWEEWHDAIGAAVDCKKWDELMKNSGA